MTAATAHVLPLANAGSHATHPEHMPTAAVFVIAGASLTEAANALGIAEATARTHRNHIFTKTGVSRRTDLLALITRLIPPVRRPH
jgi:Bacterial regulatory proteins, luxR family